MDKQTVFFEIPKEKKEDDPSKNRATARKFPVTIPYICGMMVKKTLTDNG